MKTREQLYSREAAEILRDITTYHCIRHEQLLRLYPAKKREVIDNLLTHLVQQGRIHYDPDRDWYHDGTEANTDAEMIAALWVLIDFIERVEYHSPLEFPTKLLFFAGAEAYEVAYIPMEKETLMEHALEQRNENAGKRLVIVEETAQISRLQIADVAAYCTVSDTGEVQYYKQE